MARIHVADHSFLLGAFVAAVATAIGAGTALTGLLVYSFGASPEAAVQSVNARILHGSAPRPSARNEYVVPSVGRDLDTMLRVQERRNARLQQAQENEASAEAPFSSAPTERRMFSASEYESAYDACTVSGYTRSRLAYCIDSLLQTGEYENTGW